MQGTIIIQPVIIFHKVFSLYSEFDRKSDKHTLRNGPSQRSTQTYHNERDNCLVTFFYRQTVHGVKL